MAKGNHGVAKMSHVPSPYGSADNKRHGKVRKVLFYFLLLTKHVAGHSHTKPRHGILGTSLLLNPVDI